MGWLRKRCQKCGKSGKLYRMEGRHYCSNCINYVDEIKPQSEGERIMWACNCGAKFTDKHSYLQHNCYSHYD